MDERICRNLPDTQLVERNKILHETVVTPLYQVKELLDQPLTYFAPQDIVEITELLHTTLKALQSLPLEVIQKHIPFYNAMHQGLHTVILELTLTLNQTTSQGNKASFNKHLLLSQTRFKAFFAENFPVSYQAAEPDISSIISPPKNNASLLDFSQKILPDMRTIIQKSDSIDVQQCEHILEHIQILDDLLAKQKKIGKIRQHRNDDAYDIICWRLTVSLSYANKQLHHLIYLLSVIQTKPYSQSRRTEQLREEIYHFLTMFSCNFDNILHQTQELAFAQQQTSFRHAETDEKTNNITFIHG